MNAHTPYPGTRQQRRIRAVYGTMKKTRPMVGIMAAELCALALFALVAACIVALRTWLAMPN